jgi:sugar phosphate isomerase/epimerase
MAALPALAAGQPASNRFVSFGIGTYGMRSLKIDQALRIIAEIGYDCVDLALLPDGPADPAQLGATDRRELSKLFRDQGLVLASMMESLRLGGGPEEMSQHLERLKRAIGLGHDLAPGNPPFVQTVLGLATADWDSYKSRMVDELRGWAKVAEDGNTTICFKPHTGQAANTPERAIWLVRKVGSRRLRILYDYSHMHLAGRPLEGSLRQVLPDLGFIHVKDSRGSAEHPEFLLPGDGDTNYEEYFRLLKKLNYRGYIIAEVSVMIQQKVGYEPVQAARLCYERLAPVFVKAGLRRTLRA